MIDTVEKMYDEGRFQCYKVTYVNSILLKSVPLDPENTDYQEIQQWISEGNTVIDNGE
jgi:hypothetical protein